MRANATITTTGGTATQMLLIKRPKKKRIETAAMRSVTLALAASALILLPAAGPAAAETRSCKNTYGGDVISAKNVGCKKARAIVRAWAAGYKADGNPDREVRGWRCRGYNEPAEGLGIRCTRDGKRIGFYANVP